MQDRSNCIVQVHWLLCVVACAPLANAKFDNYCSVRTNHTLHVYIAEQQKKVILPQQTHGIQRRVSAKAWQQSRNLDVFHSAHLCGLTSEHTVDGVDRSWHRTRHPLTLPKNVRNVPGHDGGHLLYIRLQPGDVPLRSCVQVQLLSLLNECICKARQ